MKCHNCGREIGDFTAFCTYCGASTGNQPAESSQITDPGKTDEPAEALPGYSEPFEQTGSITALRLHLSRITRTST